jgi:hypothetical protein
VCDAAKFALKATDFTESLYQWFVDKAPQDESIDVRARSVDTVIPEIRADRQKQIREYVNEIAKFYKFAETGSP